MAPSQQASDVGVLFVHGIGGQRRGATLVQWTDALIRWLEAAQPAAVTCTGTMLTPPDGAPAHTTVEFDDHRWTVAEAWWADTFEAPPYSTLASWSVRIIPTALLSHLMATRNRIRQLPAPRSWLANIVLSALAVPLALTFAPLLALVIGALLVVGLIPIDNVRSGVLRIQRVLTGSVGDSLILLESPTQGAAMAERVRQGVRWLRDNGSQQVVVVAHSQGAAVTKRALETSDPTSAVDTLITVGSGINKLEALRRTSFTAGWIPVGLLAVTAGLGVVSRTVLELDPAEVLRLAGAMVVLLAILAFGPVALSHLSSRISKEVQGTVFGVVVVASFVAAPVVAGDQFIWLWMLLASAILLAASVRLATAPHDDIVPMANGMVQTWLDLHARRDLVPNGPTPGATSIPVANLDSWLRDHSTYHKALDGALGYIGSVLTTGDSGLAARHGARHRARYRRLRRLRRLRLSAAAGTLAVVAASHSEMQTWVTQRYEGAATALGDPWFFAIPDTIGPRTALLAGCAIVVACGAVVHTTAAGVWAAWDRSCQMAALDVGRSTPSWLFNLPRHIAFFEVGLALALSASVSGWVSRRPFELLMSAFGFVVVFSIPGGWLAGRMQPGSATETEGELPSATTHSA